MPQKLLHIATTWSMRLKANQDNSHNALKSPNKLSVRQRVKPYFMIALSKRFWASPTRCYACRQKEAASRWSISHSLSLCNALRHLHSILLIILGKLRTTKKEEFSDILQTAFDHPHLALFDTQIDSIQCLNFNQIWFNSISNSKLFHENSIQKNIQF